MNFPCIVRTLFLIGAILILNNASAGRTLQEMIKAISLIITGIDHPSVNHIREEIEAIQGGVTWKSPEGMEAAEAERIFKLHWTIINNIPRTDDPTRLTQWQKDVIEYYIKKKIDGSLSYK